MPTFEKDIPTILKMYMELTPNEKRAYRTYRKNGRTPRQAMKCLGKL